MRVLLAEDDRELRSLLAETLTGANYEVVEAASGDAAALLVDCPDGFDVLVTDIHMPGRLDGLDLGRRFRACHPRSPILYMTGRPDAMRGVRLRPGREAVLFKPFGLSALAAAMQAMAAEGARDHRESLISYLGSRLREQGGPAWEPGQRVTAPFADQRSLENTPKLADSWAAKTRFPQPPKRLEPAPRV